MRVALLYDESGSFALREWHFRIARQPTPTNRSEISLHRFPIHLPHTARRPPRLLHTKPMRRKIQRKTQLPCRCMQIYTQETHTVLIPHPSSTAPNNSTGHFTAQRNPPTWHFSRIYHPERELSQGKHKKIIR